MTQDNIESDVLLRSAFIQSALSDLGDNVADYVGQGFDCDCYDYNGTLVVQITDENGLDVRRFHFDTDDQSWADSVTRENGVYDEGFPDPEINGRKIDLDQAKTMLGRSVIQPS